MEFALFCLTWFLVGYATQDIISKACPKLGSWTLLFSLSLATILNMTLYGIVVG